MRKRRVAILGGSFDPPHHGHILCITSVLNSGRADEVRIIPCGPRPDKELDASYAQRLTMCEIMVTTTFSVHDPVFVDPTEAGLSKAYTTIQLLCALNAMEPENEFSFIIGSELVRPIAEGEWKGSDQLLREARFHVIPRGKKTERSSNLLLSAFDYLVPSALFVSDISSTEIRATFRRGQRLTGTLPPAVIAYILRQGLYGSETKV